MAERTPQEPSSPLAPAESDRVLPWSIVAVLIVALGLPAGVALATSWSPWPVSSTARAAPNWLISESVRATSSEGAVVKARVAFDAPDEDTRRLISSQPGQVALLMQISVAEYEGAGAAGSERLQRLSADMLGRLNDYLAASRVPPVREVVIQDLATSKP